MARRGFLASSACLRPFHIFLMLSAWFIDRTYDATHMMRSKRKRTPAHAMALISMKSRLLRACIAIRASFPAPSTSKLHHNLLFEWQRNSNWPKDQSASLTASCTIVRIQKPHKSFQDSKPAVIQRTNSGHWWSQGIPRQFFP